MAEIFSERDVLVIVDMQNIFVDGAGPWGVVGYRDAERLIHDLRSEFPGPTVFTKFVADPKELGIWNKYYDAYPTTRLPHNDSAWDLTMELGPNDILISVPTFSKWGSELNRIVPQDGRIIMAGVATDCCVIATVLGAIDAGREVLVIEDACAGTSHTNHTKAMDVMGLLGPMIRVTSASELLS
jgi:nicotinamidase-related amidase